MSYETEPQCEIIILMLLVLAGAYWDSTRKSHAESIRMSDEKYVHVVFEEGENLRSCKEVEVEKKT